MNIPKIRFKGYNDSWQEVIIKDIFKITRGNVLSKMSSIKALKNIYPVYSSKTMDEGLVGYYDKYSFENAIIWSTDGYAGNVKYIKDKFYATEHCGALLSNSGYANYAITHLSFLPKCRR